MVTTACPVDCACHTGPFATCSEIGGCGSVGCGRTTTWDDRYCRGGSRCKAFDRIGRHPAFVTARDPLCDPCLAAAERDVRTLVYDYVDLAQLQTPVLSQAMDSQPGAKADPPMPLQGAPDALQREIHHVATLWANELRLQGRLSGDRRTIIVGAWHTTVTNPPPPARLLPGGLVQRATAVIAPRLTNLARLAARTVFPGGIEDNPTDMAGWEAVHHLQRLRARARGMLGWTHRTIKLPGACPNDACAAHELRRPEPRRADDDPPVTCNACGTWRTTDDYEQYVTTLRWPTGNEVAA